MVVRYPLIKLLSNYYNQSIVPLHHDSVVELLSKSQKFHSWLNVMIIIIVLMLKDVNKIIPNLVYLLLL